MEQQLAILKKTEFLGKTLSVFGTPSEPLFLAKEVADMLEHTNSRMMVQSVSEDERQCVNNPYALKGQKQQWFLTEFGLYEAILTRKGNKIAEQFRQGVKQILKEIRQTGTYTTAPSSAIADTERIIDTLIDAYNTQKHRISTLERQLSEATSISYPSKLNALTLPTNKPTNQSTNQSTNKTTNRAVPQSHRLNILQEVRYDNQDFYIYATADGTPLIFADVGFGGHRLMIFWSIAITVRTSLRSMQMDCLIKSPSIFLPTTTSNKSVHLSPLAASVVL